MSIVKQLVAHGASVHAACFKEVSLPLERKTVLQIAAGKKRTDILAYLLDNGAVIDNARGLSPLLPAAKKGNFEARQTEGFCPSTRQTEWISVFRVR